MSMKSTKLRCSGCNFESVVLRIPIIIVYHFDSATKKASREQGWCYDCNDYVDIEAAKTIKRITPARTTGARCLTCGSERTEQIHFGENGQSDFTHHCGGILQEYREVNPLRLSCPMIEYHLDEDGQLLFKS